MSLRLEIDRHSISVLILSGLFLLWIRYGSFLELSVARCSSERILATSNFEWLKTPFYFTNLMRNPSLCASSERTDVFVVY